MYVLCIGSDVPDKSFVLMKSRVLDIDLKGLVISDMIP